jgi:hypothetical protein
MMFSSRLLRCLQYVGLLLVIPGLALAGPNAGGTLILHANPSLTFTIDIQDYCGLSALDSCSAAVASVPWDLEKRVVFHVLAAFPPESQPRLKGLAFGIDFDSTKFILAAHKTCADFEIPNGGWPGPGSGTAQSWTTATQTGLLTEAYWFVGYNYSATYAADSTTFSLIPHPLQGGVFVDDAEPAAVDTIAAYGRLGFGSAGYLPCPVDADEYATFPGGDWNIVTNGDSMGTDQEPEHIDPDDYFPGLTPSNSLIVYFLPDAFSFESREAGPRAVTSVSFADTTLRATLLLGGAETIKKSFPGVTAADTLEPNTNGTLVRVPDLSGFFEVAYPDPDHAVNALSSLLKRSSVRMASVVPVADLVISAPNDSFFDHFCTFPSDDAQWFLRNDGVRTSDSCGHSIAGWDIRAEDAWFAAGGFGDPDVVIGEVDTGIYGGNVGEPSHPDLRVIPLTSAQRDTIQIHPTEDYCDKHGTNMAGIAAATTDNAEGVAGVCGDCSVLDIEAAFCRPGFSCQTHSCPWLDPVLFDAKARAALDLHHSGTWSIRVLNLELAGLGWIGTSETIANLWGACLRNVALVAPSYDSSFAVPTTIYPANLPFVLGVGGSNFRGDFWSSWHSCYYRPKHYGTAIGPSEYTAGAISGSIVDLCAPATPEIVTTTTPADSFYCADLNRKYYLYGKTKGQCSSASAQVAGAIGLLQSMAMERWGHDLNVDDAVGLLEATARPFRDNNPMAGNPCPANDCPREFYGKGILNLGAAAEALANHFQDRYSFHSNVVCAQCAVSNWQYVRVDSFQIGDTTWVEFKASADVWTGSHGGWARRLGGITNTFPSYGPKEVRHACFRGIVPPVRDCRLSVAEGQSATISGYDYGWKDSSGQVHPILGENGVRMEYVLSDEPTGGVDSREIRPQDSELRLLPIRNPLQFPAVLRFWSRRGGPVSLDILDSSGRRIRTLHETAPVADWKSIAWEGTDERGQRLASGVYWLRLRTPDGQQTKKTVLVR